MPIPEFRVIAILKDGRRFQLKVDALNKSEAIRLTKEKFPLVTIKSVSSPDRFKTAKRILWELRPQDLTASQKSTNGSRTSEKPVERCICTAPLASTEVQHLPWVM